MTTESKESEVQDMEQKLGREGLREDTKLEVKDERVISERCERNCGAKEREKGQARFPCTQLTLPTFSGGPERVTRRIRGVW